MIQQPAIVITTALLAFLAGFTGCNPPNANEALTSSHQADLGYQWIDWKDPEKIDRMQAEFELVNPFSKPLELKVEQMTCTCLHVDYPPAVAPNQKFKVILSYEPRQRAELRSEGVRFSTGVAGLPEARFSLNVFTVPKAVIMPQKYFEKTVSSSTDLKLDFDFCVYLRDHSTVTQDAMTIQVPAGMVATIHHDQCQKSDFADGYQLWKIPVSVEGSKDLDFAVGETKNVKIIASLGNDFAAAATLSVKFLGPYSAKPRQLFLPTHADGNFDVTIQSTDSSQISDIKRVAVGNQTLPSSDWSMVEGTGQSVRLKINQSALLKAIEASGQLQDNLFVHFKQGKVSVPVLKF